jgi:hypothetical protein
MIAASACSQAGAGGLNVSSAGFAGMGAAGETASDAASQAGLAGSTGETAGERLAGAGDAAASDPESMLDVPDNGTELLHFLQADAYSTWHAEPNLHVSLGPHGDRVRTFYSPKAAAALSAKATTFPTGAAAIKEEATNDGTLVGWSVWLKVRAASDAGQGFFWYEINASHVYADALGSAACTGCHSAGQDYLRSPGTFE